jgi:predicted permease
MRSLRYAIRQLVRNPGFMVVVTLMLAIGIGATTAMFSLFYQVLLQELPVRAPQELVNLGAPGPKPGITTCQAPGDCEQVFSYPMFRDLESRQTVFSGFAGHVPLSADLVYRGATQTAAGLLVSGGYFPTLGIQPALGRLLGSQDEPEVGGARVAVLSYDYWQSVGADPGVLGQTLSVNGQALTIVGVTPRGFSGTTLASRPRVFVPLALRWALEPTLPAGVAQDRRWYWLYAFARLKPGVSLEQARLGINTLYSPILNEVEAPLNAELAPDVLERFRARQVTVGRGARGQSVVAGPAAGALLGLLFALTGVVLLIVCVNVANLMLARGASRASEIAIRSSLGAGRLRLVRDLLLESITLALLGGVLSIPIAAATLKAVYALMPAQVADGLALELSPAAALFAAFLSLATVLAFGVVPALRATRVEPRAAMQGGAGHALGDRGAVRFRGALATVQVAMSMMLLVLAGLFTQSLANLARVRLGMNVESVVTFTVAPRRSGYTAERAAALYDRLERDLAAEAGVTHVASAMVPLLSYQYWGGHVAIEGDDPGANTDRDAGLNEVSNDFFQTLAIPLLSGRTFTDADVLGAPRVAVVNESFVRKFRLEGNAIGKRFKVDEDPRGTVEIVGVIADAKYNTVQDEMRPQYVLARRQNADLRGLSYYVRGSLAPDDLLRVARRVVAAADATLPLNDLATMSNVVEDNLFAQRLIATLSAGFGGLATLVAALGLYGVLAYGVARRTRELGLRLALGATSTALRVMVFKQVVRIALIGMPIGVALGVVLGHAAQGFLYGVMGHDPAVVGGAIAVLAAVVLAAGYLPARRASMVEPMEALRYE